MTKKQKGAIIGALAVLILAAFAIWGVTSRASNRYTELGALYGESQKLEDKRSGDKADFIVGKHFAISKSEFENMVSQNEVSGLNRADAEQMAYCQFIISRAIYGQAIDDGYLVDAAVVDSQINEDRAAMSEGDGREAFLSYLEGAGMTEAEYWDSMRDTYQRTMTIAQYVEDIKDRFLKEFGSDAEKWDEYCFSATQEMIEKQDVSCKDPTAWTLRRDNYNATGIWPTMP